MATPAWFSAFNDRDYRLFWIGQVLSLSGSWMQSVAQGWLVYSLAPSPVYLALVAVALTAPVLLFSLIGGVVADKVNKKKLLIITQLLSMVPALLLGTLTALGQITVPRIMALAFFLGTVNAFDLPARQAYLGEMVRTGRLMNAIALNSVAFNGTRIIGPVLAGFTIASLGVSACFFVNALSFVAGIATLLLIKGDPVLSAEAARTSQRGGSLSLLRGDIKEGFSYVLNEKDMARILMLVAVVSLFGIPFVPLLPIFAEGILKVGPRGLGFLAGSSGVGALSAAIILASVGEIRRKGLMIVAAGLVFAGGLFLFARSQEYHASLLAMLFIGGAIVSLLALVNCFIQHGCPAELRGRVMGIYTLVLIGMAPLGHALMGVMAAAMGTASALSFGSSVCFASVLLLSRPLCRLA